MDWDDIEGLPDERCPYIEGADLLSGTDKGWDSGLYNKYVGQHVLPSKYILPIDETFEKMIGVAWQPEKYVLRMDDWRLHNVYENKNLWEPIVPIEKEVAEIVDKMIERIMK